MHCKQVYCLPFLCRLAFPKRAQKMTMLWFPVQRLSWLFSISITTFPKIPKLPKYISLDWSTFQSTYVYISVHFLVAINQNGKYIHIYSNRDPQNNAYKIDFIKKENPSGTCSLILLYCIFGKMQCSNTRWG
jgi:hypothetical protein